MKNSLLIVSCVTLFSSLPIISGGFGSMQMVPSDQDASKTTSQEKFNLTITNQTQDKAVVNAIVNNSSKEIGTIAAGETKSFSIATKNLSLITIIAGSTTETVTNFTDKIIIVKKISNGVKTPIGFGSAAALQKK